MKKPNYHLLHNIGIWIPSQQKYHLLPPRAAKLASWHLDAIYDLPNPLFNAASDFNDCVRAGIVFG